MAASAWLAWRDEVDFRRTQPTHRAGGLPLVDAGRHGHRRPVADHAVRRRWHHRAGGIAARPGIGVAVDSVLAALVVAGGAVSDRARNVVAFAGRIDGSGAGSRGVSCPRHLPVQRIPRLVRAAPAVPRGLADQRLQQLPAVVAEHRRGPCAAVRAARVRAPAAGRAIAGAAGGNTPAGAARATRPALPVQRTELDRRDGASRRGGGGPDAGRPR